MKEIYKDLINIGFSKNEAELIDYIFNHQNCCVQDIVNGTRLQQPQVSIAVKNLETLVYRDLHHKDHIGRPYFTYSVNLNYIMSQKVIEIQSKYSEKLRSIQKLRELKSTSIS